MIAPTILCDTAKEACDRESEAFAFYREKNGIPPDEGDIVNSAETTHLRVNTLRWKDRDIISVYTIRFGSQYRIIVLVLPQGEGFDDHRIRK